MAQVTINEISQNYTYASGAGSFATVALPITASWGPGYLDPNTLSGIQNLCECADSDLADVTWYRFPATQSGMESFVSTYRGPAANYRIAGDYSYQMALTLLNAGYDVLVCRIAPGSKADGVIQIGSATLAIKAKHPGTFGNNLVCYLSQRKTSGLRYWNMVIRVSDPNSSIQTAVENLAFTFEVSETETAIPHISEITSEFVDFTVSGVIDDDQDYVITSAETGLKLAGGLDWVACPEAADYQSDLADLMSKRYGSTVVSEYQTAVLAYTAALLGEGPDYTGYTTNLSELSKVYYLEWLYTGAYRVYDLLKDKLTYNPQRIISPGWDDQDLFAYASPTNYMNSSRPLVVSPLHHKILDTAYYSRCAAGLIDNPRSCPVCWFYDDDPASEAPGYVQMLSAYSPSNLSGDINEVLYSTHCGILYNWGYYTLVGMMRPVHVPPSFLALLIHRAQILNQSAQYEWLLPTNRKHNLKITKLDSTVSKQILDKWQSSEGIGVNILANIPDLGINVWGDSTLFDVPPATYQALANLSTRYLVNAVEDVAYRCGVAITFQYNNAQAYDSFYAGCTPLLDTMKNQGAIKDWYIRMNADINALDQVNANTVVGQIYLSVEGVIKDIKIDLITLPASVSLDQFR